MAEGIARSMYGRQIYVDSAGAKKGELDPGAYAFSLRGSRYSGSGEVRAYNAAIHVLLLPSDRLFHSDFELP